MARPLSATDDEILDAAQAVLARRGTEAFTVSEVAREVGLTRTAIALRFKGTEDLKRLLLNRQVETFEKHFRDLNVEHGAAGLLAIADAVAQMAGSREGFSGFLLRYSSSIERAATRELEERRGQILRDVTMQAMPAVAIGPADAADAFMANLSGALMNWQTSSEPDARRFLRARTLNWLRLVGIPLDVDTP